MARIGVVLLAVVAGVLGFESVVHPIVLFGYGLPHWNDAPDVVGAGLLVVPLVVAGIGLQRLWQTLEIDEERLRLRRRSR